MAVPGPADTAVGTRIMMDPSTVKCRIVLGLSVRVMTQKSHLAERIHDHILQGVVLL